MDQQKALLEINTSTKEKAENAYLNGEIATARHLATVVLETWPDGACLGDVSWCFAILLHCYKDDTDYDYLTSRYFDQRTPEERYRFSTDKTDDGKLILFVLKVLRPSISPEMIQHWRDTFLQMSEPRLKDDVSTALLVETVIELLCFFGVNDWVLIGNHFAAVLEKESPYVAREVAQCVRRLSLQMYISEKGELPEESLDFLRPEEQLFAQAWALYFHSDFPALDSLLPQLVSAAGFESEYFLSMQGLVTSTERMRMLARDQSRNEKQVDQKSSDNADVFEPIDTVSAEVSSKESPQELEVDPLEYSKYFRYQRYESERPLAAFFAFRKNEGQKVALQIRENVLLGHAISSKCWTLFRIVPFLWSSALRYWNLSDLHKAYKRRMEFNWAAATYFERGVYHGISDYAVDAIISAVLGFSVDAYKRKDTPILIGVLEQYGSEEDLQNLYRFIFELAPPITWDICAIWLGLLGDLLPENQLHACLHWTIRYHENAKNLLTLWCAEKYDYLLPVLQNYTLTDDERRDLLFYFQSVFNSPLHNDKSIQPLLFYLADHDWALCQKLMEYMLDWENEPYYESLFINSCINLANHNSDTAPFCIDLLKRRYFTTREDSYRKFAALIETPEKAAAPDIAKCIQLLQTGINAITPERYSSDHFKEVYPCFEGCCWDDVTLDAYQAILDVVLPVLAQEQNMYPRYRVDLLCILRVIFQSANTDAQRLLVQSLVENITLYETPFLPSRPQSDALERFRLDFYRPEHLCNALLLLFCDLYEGMTLEHKAVALHYAQTMLYHFPQHAYYPTVLFLLGSADDCRLHENACMGLAQLTMIASQTAAPENKSLMEILKGIKSAHTLKKDLLHSERARSFVCSMVRVGAASVLHEHRMCAAKLTKEVSVSFPEELGDTWTTLSKDKRKSVRDALLM